MKAAPKVRRMVPRVVVPTDFSPGSTSAMAYAVALAGLDKGRVLAVHTIDPFEYSFGPKDLRFLKKEAAWTQAQEAMSEWLNANKFFSCQAGVIEGEPGPALAKLVDEERVGLLVLGTAARRRAARLLLGSVAEEIFRRANCLVLVLGPRMRVRNRELKRLVFATALEPHSLAVLPRLSKLARRFGSTVWVVRAVHPDIRSRAERARIRRETKLKFEAAADPNLRKQIKKIHVAFGEPVKAITAFANARKADAIVMGIRGGGDWDRAATHIPWALAHRVIAEARCPILTIRG